MDEALDDELQYLFERAWAAPESPVWVRELRTWADREGDHQGQALCHLAKLEKRAGNTVVAEELFREAVATGDAAYVAPEALLGDLLVDTDRGEEGRVLLRAALKTQPDVPTFEFVGEALEHAGFVLEAMSVFERGHALTGSDHLLSGRFRTRRTLGLPRDAGDQEAEDYRAALEAHMQRRLDVFDEEAPVHLALAFDGSSWSSWGHALIGGPESFDEFRADTERDFRNRSARQSIRLVPLLPDVFESDPELDPRRSPNDLRLYAYTCEEKGLTRAWPPGRNEQCWCGSQQKYKRCCLRRA